MHPETLHTIKVEGMEFYAFHGCMEEEARIGGKYKVNVELKSDFSKACQSDELMDTADYVKIYEYTSREMQQRSRLIEHVGNRIISALEKLYPNLSYIKVEIVKLSHPVGGQVHSVSYIQEKYL